MDIICVGTGYFAFYRYHIPDEIYFKNNIKVTIQELGGTSLEIARDLYKKDVKIKPVIANSKTGYLKLNAMANPAKSQMNNLGQAKFCFTG